MDIQSSEQKKKGPSKQWTDKEIEEEIKREKFSGKFLVVQSTGGLYESHQAQSQCVRMLESGPAAGVIGAPLPAQKLVAAIPSLLSGRAGDAEAAQRFARALLHVLLVLPADEPEIGEQEQNGECSHGSVPA